MKTGFIFYETKHKQKNLERRLEGWRFFLEGKLVAKSGQVFDHRAYVHRSMALTISRACQATFFNGDYLKRLPFFVVKQDYHSEKWHWDLIGANRHKICSGYCGYKTEKEAKDIIKRFKAEMRKCYRGKKCK